MKKSYIIIMLLCILGLHSCHKNHDTVSDSEYINLTLKGINYSWTNIDSLYGARVNSGSGQFYTKILGATHWNTTPIKVIDLDFGNGSVASGDYPADIAISINTITYSYSASGNTASTIVTEYGTLGNYITGTASGQIRELSSGTYFTFSCSYRVKRIL